MHRKTNAQKARAAVRDTAAAVGRAAATRRVDEDIIIEGGTYTVPPEVAAYIARLEAVETAPSVDGEDEPVADAEPAEATTEALEQAAEAVLAAAAAIEADAPMSEAEPAELAVLDADGDEAVEAMGTGPRDPEPGMAELEDEDEATTAAKTDAAQPSRDAVLARAIRARLDQRSELVAIAARIIPRLDHRASDDALMREVVRRVAPAVAKRADSSSGDYLRAMFDLAVAQHNEAAEQATRNDAASLTATATTRTPADELDAALAGYGSRFSR